MDEDYVEQVLLEAAFQAACWWLWEATADGPVVIALDGDVEAAERWAADIEASRIRPGRWLVGGHRPHTELEPCDCAFCHRDGE